MTEKELVRYLYDKFGIFGKFVLDIARWHLSELKKAELRASIGEVQSAIQMTLDFETERILVNRLSKLQSKLRKLEEGK